MNQHIWAIWILALATFFLLIFTTYRVGSNLDRIEYLEEQHGRIK